MAAHQLFLVFLKKMKTHKISPSIMGLFKRFLELGRTPAASSAAKGVHGSSEVHG